MGDVFFGPVQTSPEKRKREAFENEDDVTVQLDSPSLATGAWGSSPANKTPVSAPVWRSSPLSNKSLLVNLQTPKSEVKPSGPTEPKAYEDLLHLFSVRKSAKQSSAAKHNTLDTRFDTIPSPTAARSARDSPRLSLPVQEQPESAGNEGAAYDQDGTRPLDVGHTTEIQQHSDSAILDNNMVSPEKLPSPSRTSPEASTALNKLATHRVISEVPMHKQPKHSPEAASTPVAAEETIDASTSIPSFPTPQSKPTPANFVNTRRRQYTTASSKLPRAPFSRPQPAFQVSADASISKTPLLSASLSSSTSSSSSHGTASLVQPQLQQEKPKLPVKSKMPRPMHHHQSSGRPPTPASQQPHPSDGLERGTDPLSDPETTQQDSTIVEETAEEKPSRRKKTSLNTVKQVADRLFAPGHFFEASEPAAELVASNSSSVEPQLSHVDQDHVHQNATAVTPQEQRKTRLKTTTRLTSHAPKPLSSQNAPTCTRSVAPPPPSSRALQLSTPQAAPPAAPLKQFAPDMTAQQLTSVTALNTSRNKRCYNEHEVVVIHKNELRPPSPSSRIRKTVTGATKQGREQRAQRRGAMKEEGAATCQQTPVASGSTGSHPMAAGDDDEGYSSPKRSRTGSKSVKWSRALIHDDIATRPPCEPGDSSAGLSSVLAKGAALDEHGNALNAKQPLSPLLPRQHVTISKLIYIDDQ